MPIGQATNRAGIAFYPTSQYNPYWLGSLLGTGPLISASLAPATPVLAEGGTRKHGCSKRVARAREAGSGPCLPCAGGLVQALRLWRMSGAPDLLLHDMHPIGLFLDHPFIPHSILMESTLLPVSFWALSVGDRAVNTAMFPPSC